MGATNIFRTPNEVVWGMESYKYLDDILCNMGAKKVLFISDTGVDKAGILKKVRSTLKKAKIKAETLIHRGKEPTVEDAESAGALVRENKFDCLVGIGGGSALDLAKVAAVMKTNSACVSDMAGIDNIEKPGLPFILMPTTAGTGSEVTPNAILSFPELKVKKGLVSKHLYCQVAIVDPLLTVSMPREVTAATGMDAFVHALESFVAKRESSLTNLIAVEAIRLIAGSIREAYDNGENVDARDDMARGSLFAGISLANAGVGAVHALAYPLGGSFGISHGVSNSLLLPWVLERNIRSKTGKFAALAAAMGEAVEGMPEMEAARLLIARIKDFLEYLKIPQRLRDIGVPQSAIPDLAEAASKQTRLLSNNPCDLSLKEITHIYESAW
ncbi:MAG: iron-containing alcohol dehydrogenase [Spirochaetes bacterium]|nr:iron-containing alcohol dehydrogenase [Spirochaetota bacterium]